MAAIRRVFVRRPAASGTNPGDSVWPRQEDGHGSESGTPSYTKSVKAEDSVLVLRDTFSTPSHALGGLATFTSGAIDTLGYSAARITLLSDVSSAEDGFRVEYSHNGVDWFDGEDPYFISANTLKTFTFTPALRYSRILYDNGAAAQGTFLAVVTLTVNPQKWSSHKVTEEISDNTDAEMVKAVLSARRPTGTQTNIGGSPGGALKVTLEGSEATTAGSVFSEGIRDDIGVSFVDKDPNDILVSTGSGGTATKDTAQGQALFETGTTMGNTTIFTTRATALYDPAHEIRSEFTIEVEAPPTHASGKAIIGLMNASNGFAVGYIGTSFGILYRRAGVDTFTPQADFNVDDLFGLSDSDFTRQRTPESYNPQKNNLWRIRFEWLGAATISFDVKSPDGVWVTAHTLAYPNLTTGSSLTQHDLPMRAELSNAGSTTNVRLRSGSWRAGTITAALSNFGKLMQRVVSDSDELRTDLEPTNTDYYLGKAADGTPTTTPTWDVVRVYLSATRKPVRIRFRKNVAWDSKQSGWS